MSKIRVLLAEDHAIVREGLRRLLEAEADIEVVGEAADGHEAVEKAQELTPDVVVMDISMPRLNGLEATRRIKKQVPQVKVLILTVHKTDEYIFPILHAGASGYVVKDAAPEDLISAIRAANEGEPFLSPVISKRVVEEFVRRGEAMTEEDDYARLTNREREVLQLIAEGNSNRQIARSFTISVRTVETHRAHIMDKLGIRTTAELTQYAIRKGVIRADP